MANMDNRQAPLPEGGREGCDPLWRITIDAVPPRLDTELHFLLHVDNDQGFQAGSPHDFAGWQGIQTTRHYKAAAKGKARRSIPTGRSFAIKSRRMQPIWRDRP
jgi:hypothetical protein